MAPEQKADIVCAFHGDLEGRLDRIETKIDSIRTQLNAMQLWRAEIRGAAAVAAFVISTIVTLAILVLKYLIFK
jgi:hypothetical protein